MVPPPEWFVWLGSIAGIAALVLGVVMLPTLFQIFWGRPVLNTRFDVGAESSKRWLQVFLENRPIEKTWLKALGVRRETIQSLQASLRLAEVGSGKIIIPIRQLRIYPDDTGDTLGRFRISLPATYSVGAGIMVVTWDEASRTVVIPPNKEGEQHLVSLSQGYYEVTTQLIADGQPHPFRHRFRVGRTPDELMWSP